MLCVATAALMQGSPLRMYVGGSAKYDYNGTPWWEWSAEAGMLVLSAVRWLIKAVASR
jgi:hypothetical protein